MNSSFSVLIFESFILVKSKVDEIDKRCFLWTVTHNARARVWSQTNVPMNPKTTDPPRALKRRWSWIIQWMRSALLLHTRRVVSVATGTSGVYWSRLNYFFSGSCEQTISHNNTKTLKFRKTTLETNFEVHRFQKYYSINYW